jgi:hypothetical protein
MSTEPPNTPDGHTEQPPGDDITEELVLAFAPLHKRAFGTAIGLTAGLAVVALTAVHVIFRPEEAISLSLLGQYFYGYSVSWPGALIGGAWAFFAGFVAGWFTAFCRNLIMATWLFIGLTKAELGATRDFLDHV